MDTQAILRAAQGPGSSFLTIRHEGVLQTGSSVEIDDNKSTVQLGRITELRTEEGYTYFTGVITGYREVPTGFTPGGGPSYIPDDTTPKTSSQQTPFRGYFSGSPSSSDFTSAHVLVL